MAYCMYLRKSRKDSENPSFTDEEILSRHQQLLEETAERQGLQIAAIYREIVSGDSIAGRPVMQQLLQEVRSASGTGCWWWRSSAWPAVTPKIRARWPRHSSTAAPESSPR